MDQPPSEGDLLKRAVNGDRQAFTQLYTNHLTALYRYIYPFTGNREDTQEIIQEVFATIWEKREKFAAVDSFRSYLFRMARNRVLNHIRDLEARRRRHPAVSVEHDTEQADHHLLYTEYYRIAMEAINHLPPRRREIFRLSTEKDMTLQEIADNLGISKSVVKKQLYAANDFVRGYLREHGHLSAVVAFCMALWSDALLQ